MPEVEDEEEDDNNFFELEDYDKEALEKLVEIGIKKDYFDFLDSDLLGDIVKLPFLNREERDYLETEIMNINYGMSFFQDEANELLKEIIRKYNSGKYDQFLS